MAVRALWVVVRTARVVQESAEGAGAGGAAVQCCHLKRQDEGAPAVRALQVAEHVARVL